MRFTLTIVASLIQAAVLLAFPVQDIAENFTSTATLSATLTISITSTIVTTLPSEITTCYSSEAPKATYVATEIYAMRPGSPIHLLPFQAVGTTFQLGGTNTAYCPRKLEKAGACTFKNVTGFTGCGLSVYVPGGQAVYMAPDGQLKYTQAHSARLDPANSWLCPLTFTPVRNSDVVHVGLSTSRAQSFLACPLVNSTRTPGKKQQWQVFGKVENRQIPIGWTGYNSSCCTEFEAVGVMVQMDYELAAWQYV